MNYAKRMYIGGELVDGEGRIDVVNPANEQKVGSVAAAGVADVDKALQAAQAAVPMWSRTSISQRQEWMYKLRDAVMAHENELRTCIHHEMGKSWAGTQEDFDSLKNSLAFYAEEIARIRDENLPDRAGTHTHRLVHEPVGVAVAYLAWNFPLLNLAFKIGPALAAGCPIIIKPAPATPISAYIVGELCHKIGLPAGVVNILTTIDNGVADRLTASEIPALLTLIGSTTTGKHIMKTGATSIKRYSMELGGNAPALIFADADLDHAADIVCAVKFGNAGQVCVAPNRVFVEQSVATEFEAKVLQRARAVLVGWDKDAPIDMGPVIDARAWSRIDGFVKDAVDRGARLLCGGGKPDGMNAGQFYAPTVLGDVTSEMKLYHEEIFGPVISLMTFSDETDVLARANDTDAGLTSYVFSRDLDRAERCAGLLCFGEVQINGVKYDIDLPHGGIGQSGLGHDCSHLALHDYLTIKRVTRALAT